MDTFFRTLGRYAQSLSNDLGNIAQRLDGEHWAALSAVLLVCGWFFLRGNKIKST